MFDFTERFNDLATLLVGLQSWKDWVGSTDDAVLRSRITWPLRSANLDDYPYINLSTGPGRWANLAGGLDSSANFQPNGGLRLRIWDADSNLDNPQASFEAFEANASGLLTALVDAACDGPLIMTDFIADEPAVVHSHDNIFVAGSDEDSPIPKPVWMASLLINWGVAA